MKDFDPPYASSPCLICGESMLRPVPGFAVLPRVSSDCRPFAAGGELAVCENCALVQKFPDPHWLAEIAAIYGDYSAYGLAGGEEQLVLDPRSGMPCKRSEVLMRALQDSRGALAGIASALDVGCGHGVTLAAMANAFPDWELYGYELDGSKLEVLRRIRKFRHLYTGGISTIDRSFGFISMIHSLEHFVDPLQTLRSLGRIATREGRLFIEVCNVEENPFDLLVADHLTHFSPATLALAVNRAGYAVARVATDWVRKEISLLATRDERMDVPASPAAAAGKRTYQNIAASVAWLDTLISNARACASRASSFGIFGTSIAGTWLATALDRHVEFFVDEDPNRVGREYMGKAVLAPQDVPGESSIFLALAPTLAQAIKERFSHMNLDLVLPPVLRA